MRKKIMFTIFLILLFCDNIGALNYRGCDSSKISRLKSLISNINISYEYKLINGTPSFDVTINNIPSDVYFVDSKDIYYGEVQKKYYFSDTKNGELTIYNYYGKGGSYKFYSNIQGCKEVLLGKKYYKFPVYNPYYGDSLCEGISNYSLCQKWVNVSYSHQEFEEKINEYKKSKEIKQENQNITYEKTIIDYIVDLYVKYYYLFLIGIIVVFIPVIIVKKRKDKIKL